MRMQHDRHQLHLGHHRQPERGDVQPPRPPACTPWARSSNRRSSRTPSISGPCRCFTATAGVFPGRSRRSAATHVCLRRSLPKEIFHLIEKERVSHLCAAPNVLLPMICFPGGRRGQAAPSPAGSHRRGLAVAGDHPGHGGDRRQYHPCLRPDRTARPAQRLRLAGPMDRTRSGDRRQDEGPAGGALRSPACTWRWSTRRPCSRCPRTARAWARW